MFRISRLCGQLRSVRQQVPEDLPHYESAVRHARQALPAPGRLEGEMCAREGDDSERRRAVLRRQGALTALATGVVFGVCRRGGRAVIVTQTGRPLAPTKSIVRRPAAIFNARRFSEPFFRGSIKRVYR